MLGFDMVTIPDFLRETRALAVDVGIEKLRKQIARMKKMKSLNAPSNSTSALVSTSAPSSDGAAQMVAMNNGGAQRVGVKRGRDRDSSPNFGSPDSKRARSITGVPIKQHGKYVCLSNIHPHTYETAVNMAEFLFKQLLKVPLVHSWKRVRNVWLQNLP